MFHFRAALQGDQCAQLQLANGTFGRNFGQMRGAIDEALADSAPLAGRMPAEITKISRGESSQQSEIDYDARRISRIASIVVIFWQNRIFFERSSVYRSRRSGETSAHLVTLASRTAVI